MSKIRKNYSASFKAKVALEALKKEKDTEEFQAELYQQIGQLKVELDWLKKKSKLFS